MLHKFPHELTCQILTDQSIKIGRRAWPARDRGKKRSSPPVFLKNWLNFCVRGQFEIEILIVWGHSDINTTCFILIIKKNFSLRSFETGNMSEKKKLLDLDGRHLSPRYGQVILVSGYPVLIAVNWSQHWCAIAISFLCRFLKTSQTS